MSDPLYRLDLLRFAADAHGAGRLSSPHATGTSFNPACGDKIVVDVVLADGCIAGFAHETNACVLAQASASILGGRLVGSPRDSVERLEREIVAMLEQNAPPPLPPFGSYSAFVGAIQYPSRHRCVLLPVEAVLNALEKFRKQT